MNSGCYDNDISKVLLSITALDINKLQEVEIKKEDINFSYRGTNLPDDFLIIISKTEILKESKKKIIEKKQLNFIEKKKSQPSQIKTCGSTFKNISEIKKPWMLIKESGCDRLLRKVMQ